MKLDEVFERVYVLNLPFKKERQRRLTKNLDATGSVNTKSIVWHRAVCGDWTPPPDWWGAGNGAWGCLISHLRIGQDAVHDELASYCVLVDDAVFHPHAAEMLNKFAQEIPLSWKLFYPLPVFEYA